MPRAPSALPPSRAIPLIALLAITLTLTGLIAMEAWRALRAREVTVAQALADYAAFAAHSYATEVRSTLDAGMGQALNPAIGASAASPYDRLPGPAVLAAAAARAFPCGAGRAPDHRLLFRLDLRDGSFATSGADETPTFEQWLKDTVQQHAQAMYRPDSRGALLLGGPSPDRAVVYGLKYALVGAVAQPGGPVAAYGFTLCREGVQEGLLRTALRHADLLPASLAGRLPSESLLVLTVAGPTGQVLLQTDSAPPPLAEGTGVAQLAVLGGLSVRALLRPSVGARLGQVHESLGLPTLLALLVLAVGLTAAALWQLRREYELVRLRQDLLASVSHELRTPLAQILLFSETLSLQRTRTEKERDTAVETIVLEARRLMHLVENTLHYSRIERSVPSLSPRPNALAASLAGIGGSFAPYAVERGMTLRTTIEGDLTAMVDEGALRQMVLNLLDNAVKYGPRGQTITLGLDRLGDTARIRVEDQGPGVPADMRERVWEPYVRLENGTTAGSGGTGLGLPVVRALAQAHGGQAWSESSPTGSARFVIVLPLAGDGRNGDRS